MLQILKRILEMALLRSQNIDSLEFGIKKKASAFHSKNSAFLDIIAHKAFFYQYAVNTCYICLSRRYRINFILIFLDG